MKSTERLQYYRRFWAIGLAVALLILGQFTVSGAQILKPKITATGTDDTFEQVLTQPAQFLKTVGITPEEIQLALHTRVRILVAGAGFTRDIGLISPLSR